MKKEYIAPCLEITHITTVRLLAGSVKGGVDNSSIENENEEDLAKETIIYSNHSSWED